MTDSAQAPRRQRARDRGNEHQTMISIPLAVDERAHTFNLERAPHLSQNALWIEAMIFYLDAKGARFPEAKP